MGAYDQRPWLALYERGLPSDIEPEFPNGLELFAAAVARAAERPFLHYFDATLSFAEVDRLSDGLAVGLQRLGVQPGSRVAVYLQNIPQFVIALLAAWKLGGIVVPVNPMLKERELAFTLNDSGACVLVALESLYHDVAAHVLPETPVRVVVTTSELDLLAGRPPALLHGVERRRAVGAHDLLELARAHDGERPPPVLLAPTDVAFLTYTSGTTGPPKGALNTHGNVVFNAQAYRDWIHLTEQDVVLGVAPLFHITGLIAHVAVAMLVPMPIVLAYRFDAGVSLGLIERYGATFTVAAITVYLALLNHPAAADHDISSLAKAYSGGAPIAPATVEAYERRFGTYIRTVYGLTETTSPTHMVPFDRRAPVDPLSGALSVGVPIFNTICRIVDDERRELPAGEVGELVLSGPEVVPGYWQQPEETAHAFPGGELHTGDVGFMDGEGWFYIVDRKKDLINAAGYKVWPREVEDVLYGHPAVREAAVVGVPDPYRGETVIAFVSLRPGRRAEPAELIAWCRERLAAYKVPRQLALVDELPKTPTGKILRRELRQGEIAAKQRPF